MPTLPRSPARSIHSWSLVYLKLAGYAMSPLSCGCSPLVERHRDHPGARAAAADVHVELGARHGVIDGQIRHADRLLQVRRLRAARDRADPRRADVHVVPMAGDAAVDHLEAGDLPRDASGFLPAQRLGADEVRLVPADDPAEIGLERRGRLVDVAAVETHRCFETQRIARPEAAGNEVDGLPRVHD